MFTMKKLFVILGSLFFLVLVTVVGLAAWVLTFDANANKDWIAAKFQEQTGRELTLGGNIDVSVYPWLGVNADAVSISNAVGFSSSPLLSADHMAFRIKLMPLLRSRYEIDTVVLDGVHVNLEVQGNGQNNWSSLTGGSTPAQESTAGGGGNAALLNNLIIGGVRITNTSLVYDDRFANTYYEMSNLDLSIGELVYGDPLDIRMTLDAASRNPQLAAAVAMDGTVLYDMDSGRYDLDPLTLRATLSGPTVPSGSAELSLDTALHMDLNQDTLTLNNLELAMLDTRINAQVQASRVQTATPAVIATLDARGDDLAVLFRIIEQNELADRISSLDSRFAITASVDADLRSGTLNVTSLQAQLLNADISGVLQVNRFNTETPAILGNINATGPDLPTLIEVVGMLQGGRSSPLSQAGRDLATVPNKSFQVQTRFDANLEQSRIDIPELYLGLFGATINGTVSASNIDDSARLQASGELNAQGPDLPLLMEVAGQLQGGRDNALYEYGNKLRLGVRNRAFTLNTGFTADMARGNVQLPALTAAMLGFRINANLNARDLQGNNGVISGALSLQGEDLREVLTALDQKDLADVTQRIDLNLEVGGGSSNLRLSPFRLDLVLSGPQIPNSPQSLRLDADTILNLDNKSLQADSFSLSGLGLNLNGKVAATNIDTAPAFQGELNIPAFNARRFLEQLNQPLPPMTDNTVLQNVALSTAFGGSASSFNLNNMRLQMDDSTITGSLAISDLASMSTNFTVNIDRIDADRYMAPATTSPDPTTEEAAPLPVEDLRRLNVQGSLNIGQLTITQLDMRDIVIELNARSGELSLYPFQAKLYDGTFTGDIRLNVQGEQPSASVTTQLADVNLGPLLQDFMESTYITGSGNIQLSLAGNGDDIATIKRSLNGQGQVELADGVLSGVDVAAVLNTIETMIRSRRVVALPQGGTTPFEESAATLAINSGVVSTNNLSIKAPGWKLGGNGTLVDLNSERINFNLLVEVDPATVTSQETEYNLGGYSLPIACTGAIDSPRCLPDAQQIITAAVGNVVQQRLGELLQDRLGGGQQQATPAPADSQTQQQQPQQQEQPRQDPAEELLNRALDRLRR
jgi:uncharacterized protein involved in outer membrane biogenesis